MEQGAQLYLGRRDTANGTNRTRYLAPTPKPNSPPMTMPASAPQETSTKMRVHFTALCASCLTTELSGRPRCRLPHAEPANNLLASRVRPTIVHGPLQRVVS